MDHSNNVRVYLAAMSNPAIENCSAIAFAEYPSLLHASVDEPLPRIVSVSNICQSLL